jgi:hypothetical protein
VIKMGLENNILRMEIVMRESTKITNLMDKVHTHGKVKLYTKVNSNKEKDMVVGYGNRVINYLIYLKESIQMIIKMVMVFILGLMAQYLKEVF